MKLWGRLGDFNALTIVAKMSLLVLAKQLQPTEIGDAVNTYHD